MKFTLHFNLDDREFANRHRAFGEASSVLSLMARALAVNVIGGRPPDLLPVTDSKGRRIGECVVTAAEALEYPTCAAAEIALGRTMTWREEHARYVGYFDEKSVPIAIVRKPPREGNPGV
jgi:hypothetical protein